MNFVRIPSPFLDMPLFGAQEGQFTFIISQDDNDAFSASVKHRGAKAFDGTLGELGYRSFKTFDEAKAACEKFINDRH